MTEAELKKLVFYLDGLRYSFQMANLVSDRLKETLNEIAQCHSKDEYTEKQISSVLLDAWTLIDICHRVRELVQQMPRLERKPPGFRVFLRETECIENLRHYVQHFGSGIRKIPFQSNPLWGVLSWPTKDKTTSYTIFSGNLAPGVSGPSLVLDTHKRQFADEINLHANGVSVNLLLIYGLLVKLKI